MAKILLAPFALIYGIAIYIRNYLFDWGILKSQSFGKSIICVGNLTVGGTGKTPHIEYLIKILKDDFCVATLSRGYKRKTKGFRIAAEDSTPLEMGDEPIQLHSKFPEITVAVDEKRVRGINKLLYANKDINVILLDDAFQHRYVKPGHSILLTDYNNLVTRDHFLPMGKLRDSITQLHRAETIIVTKCPPQIKPIDLRIVYKELNLYPYQKLYFTSLTYGKLEPVFKGIGSAIEASEKLSVIALAGIANPILFFNHLHSNYLMVDRIELPDHYHFTEKKIKAIFEKFSLIEANPKAIITTEKDAARIRHIEGLSFEMKRVFFYIPIEVEFLCNKSNEFNNKIREYVRKSFRNNGIHQR